MRIRTRTRRLLAGVAVLPLVTAGLTAGTAGAAQAAEPCGQSWSDKDKGGYGYGKSGQMTPVRDGIYGSCWSQGSVGSGYKLHYHCYRRNSYGNTWTHVRVEGITGLSGWVWDGNLNDNGSIYPC